MSCWGLFRLHVAFYLSYRPCVHVILVGGMSMEMLWGVLPIPPPSYGRGVKGGVGTLCKVCADVYHVHLVYYSL